MKHTKFILLITALMCMNMTYMSAQSNINADKKTVEHLKKYRVDNTNGLLNNKPELITTYYSDSIWLMPAFQKTILSKMDAHTYYEAFLTRFNIEKYEREDIEILDLGSQVLEIGNFTMEMVLKSTDKKHELVGTYFNIWKKSQNGSLLLITEAWNYNQYYEGVDNLLRFDDVPAVHMAFQPNVYVNSNISFELAALNRLLDATVTQHDANVWSQYYADDSMLITNYHPICHGKKEIDEYIDTHVKELPVFEELDIRNHRIDNLGKYVVEYASHIASWKGGEHSGVGLGKNIRIWRREPDNSLKLFRTIGMYD